MGTASSVKPQLARTEVEPDVYRLALGQVPTAVTVCTSATPDGPVGLTVGSFVSVSLKPPLIGLFVDEKSVSWPAMERAGSFAVNVLAEEQGELCARFARSGGEKFAGLTWWDSPLGHPLFAATAAWLDCTVHEVRPVGDHLFVVGHVSDLGTTATAAPMVFHRGALTGLAAGQD